MMDDYDVGGDDEDEEEDLVKVVVRCGPCVSCHVVLTLLVLRWRVPEYALWRQETVARAFVWLAKQPSSRPHWDAEQLVLCALSADP